MMASIFFIGFPLLRGFGNIGEAAAVEIARLVPTG
jgi:hypothetical protein